MRGESLHIVLGWMSENERRKPISLGWMRENERRKPISLGCRRKQPIVKEKGRGAHIGIGWKGGRGVGGGEGLKEPN